MSNIIQLLHPGVEPNIKNNSTYCPINTSSTHKRKFIQADVDYLDGNGDLNKYESTFWGEWELASNVSRIVPSPQQRSGLPMYIHKPIWPQTVPGLNIASSNCSKFHYYQNTDPFVFCNPFLHFCCHINHGNILDRLSSGDVVIFGSHIAGQFVFDTLFVVADRIPARDKEKYCNDFYQVNTPYLDINPYIYRGATYKNPVNGMFSFFSCKVLSESTSSPTLSFARPALPKSNYINPAMKQNYKKTNMSNSELFQEWNSIKDLVQSQGLSLGLRAYL